MNKIRYIVMQNGSGYPHHLFINLSELEKFTLLKLISSRLGLAESKFEIVSRGVATGCFDREGEQMWTGDLVRSIRHPNSQLVYRVCMYDGKAALDYKHKWSLLTDFNPSEYVVIGNMAQDAHIYEKGRLHDVPEMATV